MVAEDQTRDPPAPGRRRGAYPKWRYVYFLLAAFDLMTVCAGLYLNHRIMNIYTGSVAANRIWADRVAAYSHLGELAAAVDAPGNDVFDSGNVPAESAKMHAAMADFDLELAADRRELRTNLAEEVAAPLTGLLDAIAGAKKDMTNEAERIFDYFRAGRPDQAGARMATMDRKYANLNAALLELRHAVGVIQQHNFQQQTAAAADLQQFEYLIGLSIVLMVAGATAYGHKIARQMQADTEEKQRHLDALAEAEARTRSILDTAADGIVSFDEQGRIESFNHAAERLFGYADGAAIGADIRVLIPHLAACLGPRSDDESGAAPPGAPCILGGKCIGDQSLCRPIGPHQAGPCVLGGDQRGRRRDDSDFPLELSASKVSIGRTPIFTGIVRDLTDRQRTEEALRTAATAQAASRAKSQFLANMSHEIRTPMNGILGMAEMLLQTELSPTQRRLADTVYRSGESLLGVIGNILDFSKIEAGKLELEGVDFNPRELVEEMAQLMAEAAERKGLELFCRVAPDVPQALHGAASRLRQVLTNLVGNAIKFTEHGEVSVEVSRLAGPAAGDIAGGTMLQFTVKDTGIGIPMAIQGQLFNAFTQADNSTTRRYGGSGLGLAISKELLERMGGKIGVRSVPGQGAEFWFVLRLAPAQVPIGEPDGCAFAGQRALVVTHRSTGRRILERQLRALGMQVRRAEDGLEGIALLRRAAREQNPFAVAVVDAQLPDLAPDAFAATVAAEPAIAAVRLVLMLPAAAREERPASCGTPFHARVAMPFRDGELRQAIATALEGRRGEFQPGRSETAGLGGLRVLLAEDNPVNQDVARIMLESLDCEVQAVDNGRKALAALDKARFDIVLMDCQMPEMDGLEATAEIRARRLRRPRQPPGATLPVRLPIVALTANAVKGDREICLAAGMDDHLVKPFRRDALRRVLERWALDQAAPAVDAAAEEATAHTLDRTMLEQIRRNRRPGTPCPVAGLIDRYLDSAEDLIAALRDAAAATDADGLARGAHSLRSGSAFVGARRLAGLCEELGRAVRSGDIHDAARRIDLIAREYEDVRAALIAAR